ncbi:MAG: glucose-1-phosphate adenylyltransferase [Synergistaceae bacterium]|jgi:glucose-1-phosphate adenylyltransferase|nr:glucose-1-phosphate adenylyltransferase [Synergistaceae bacterium]
MYGGKYGRVLGVVLAGGKGERLMPLTRYRAKPAVYFGGKYRIIDFALSNFINSGIFAVYVLVQFKSQSLNEHIERGWQFGSALRGRDFFVTLVPAQMWRGEHWFQGTADAVFQNLHLISLFNADHVCIFAADHIYKMDIDQMLAFHVRRRADVTVAANAVPIAEASQFGCIKADMNGRIIEFQEKPANPPEIPDKPGYSYVSMGNYIFDRAALEESLIADSQQPTSHDFGRDIIPGMVKDKARVFAYDFSTNVLPHSSWEVENMHQWREDRPYWRDVGTISAYWRAHMELLSYESEMTLYNPMWPIRTVSFADPPSYSYPTEGNDCVVRRVLMAEGGRILGARVENSVLSRNCVIQPSSVVEESVIGQGVIIGRNCRIKRAIIDANNCLPDNTVIGEDPEADARLYTVDPSGITVMGMPRIQYQQDVDEKALDTFSWTTFS